MSKEKEVLKPDNYVMISKDYGDIDFIARIQWIGNSNVKLQVTKVRAYCDFIQEPKPREIINEGLIACVQISKDTASFWEFFGHDSMRRPSDSLYGYESFSDSLDVIRGILFAWKVAERIFGDKFDINADADEAFEFKKFVSLIDDYDIEEAKGRITEQPIISKLKDLIED